MTELRRTSARRRTAAFIGAGAVMAVVAAGLISPTGAFGAGAPATAGYGNLNLLGAPVGLDDVDMRTGSLAPSATQVGIVNSLGAHVTWNRFGTPDSLIKYGGYLGTGLSSDPVAAARAWVKAHAALFRLSSASVDGLELLNDSPMRGSAGHAILFRQHFGALAATQDGLITVGVAAGKVAYVSSSSAGDLAGPPAASLSVTDAWLKAAANVGRPTSAGALSATARDNSWTVFTATGFVGLQRGRLVALPTPTSGVRPVYEVNVLDVQRGLALAYTSFVDAVSGNVLVRINRTQQNNQTQTFTGSFTPPTTCGPMHPYTVDASTKSIDVIASATVPSNDIVLNLIHNGTIVASSDTATSPEAIHYAPAAVDPGVYNVQVCPFSPPMVPFVPPYTYVGVFESNDAPNQPFPYPPQWKYFTNAPPLTYADTDTRIQACWQKSVNGATIPGCQLELKNLASRAPWDQNVMSNTPTFTTLGNNANTAEAWTSPLTPGPFGQRPVDPDRKYFHPWTNQWFNEKCAQTAFASAQRNDIDASVTNLFSGHNRFHDFSYFLGFTEQNYNAQQNNFGNTAPGPYPLGRENDPETGDVQAGAVTGGAPSYLGRDNANQITLQDGVPPITNQYLFQPIAGAFYAPCVDGDYDTSVFGHEYTHLISNRMVAGPDSGLSGYQAGSMGESWSDQVALEYLHEYNYVPQNGENPWAEGPYVTKNKATGIRNYALNANPLNYSDLGYDLTGPEVHADGEIWNAVAYDIRQALVAKYNGAYPESNAGLQKACADGVRPANLCPGNRRWIQIVFDAFLLQPSGSSMLTARDAYLAADMMRFGGANQAPIWNAFAKRGFGQAASTNGTADSDAKPDFTSPYATEATLQFKATDMTVTNQPAQAGKLYVGRYEARATPIATTDPASSGGLVSVQLVPGTYDFTFQANGYGIRRFTMTLAAGQVVQRVLHLSPNLASKYKGATATTSTGGVNADSLIDDTEATNWAALNQGDVSATKPSVTVKLAGTGPQTVRSVQVSAMLRPADPNNSTDPGSQNRFTALRKFAIQTCDSSVTTNAGCTSPTSFTTIYTSPDDAFPSVAPRPLAPDLLLRTFDVPDTSATHVKLVVLQNQCTGGPAYQGEQDNDPANATDCGTTVQQAKVRAAELEVYSFDAVTRPPGDPVVVTTMTAPATASTASAITYGISYTNLGPNPSALATIIDTLPAGLQFVAATNGGSYNATKRTVTWKLGTVAVNGTGTVGLTAKVTAGVGSTILNQATFTGADTVGLPSAAATLVVP